MKQHYQNPMVNKALKILEELSADEKIREMAERREKVLRDEAMFLNEAKKSGKKEIAIRLLKMNLLTIEQIAEATDLKIREITELKTLISKSDQPS
jgi:predicted transposase/invertase (TIGR01784 family)